jgi:hypothetical protein
MVYVWDTRIERVRVTRERATAEEWFEKETGVPYPYFCEKTAKHPATRVIGKFAGTCILPCNIE